MAEVKRSFIVLPKHPVLFLLIRRELTTCRHVLMHMFWRRWLRLRESRDLIISRIGILPCFLARACVFYHLYLFISVSRPAENNRHLLGRHCYKAGEGGLLMCIVGKICGRVWLR
jgi:hypothetical protein